MPLVSLIDLENSIKMNQFINQQHSQFGQHHLQHQQQQQQQAHVNHHHHHHAVNGSPAASYFNHNISSPASAFNGGGVNALNNIAAGQTNSSNLIANEILSQIQSMNAINLNNKLLTNITNNLMMNGIKSSAATNILNGINLNALSQSIQNKQVNYSRYKTELCRQFSENGECKYGDKCQFAHGFGDLKDVNRHPKYKTDFCKTFHSKGFCPYGPRCHFIHDLSEKFDMTILNVASPGPIHTSISQAAHDSMIINKYLNMNAYKQAQAAAAAAAAQNEFGKDGQIDKELEAIQMQITSTLFSSSNEDPYEEDRVEDKKAPGDTAKTELKSSAECKTDKEAMVTPQASLDELEVSLSQSLSLLSYAQSPSLSSSASSSNCPSSAASSHVSSSGSSKSSSPVSSSSSNIIGESNPAYMALKSSSEPNIGVVNGAQGKYMVENLFSSNVDVSKNDPLSILLLSPSPSPSSSSSSSSANSARSSTSSSNENVYQSSNNLYFNNPLNDISLVSKARLASPVKVPQQAQLMTKPGSDSSLLAINNANMDPTGLSPSMIQFLRQHCNQPTKRASTIGQDASLLGAMTPSISAAASTSAIGSHLSKANQGAKMSDNLSSYFNNNINTNMNQNNIQQLKTGHQSSSKYINW